MRYFTTQILPLVMVFAVIGAIAVFVKAADFPPLLVSLVAAVQP